MVCGLLIACVLRCVGLSIPAISKSNYSHQPLDAARENAAAKGVVRFGVITDNIGLNFRRLCDGK